MTIPEGKTIEKKDYLKKTFTTRNSFFSDIFRLREYADSSHTNLYYSYLRTFLIGFTNFTLEEFIKRGVLANILLLIISFFTIFYTLNKYYTLSNYLSLTLAFTYTILPGSISNLLFIRPYQLQTTCLLIFHLFFLSLNSERGNNSLKTILFIISLTSLFLSGYFSLLYLTIFYIVFFLRTKQFHHLKYLMAAFLLTLFIYPSFFTPLVGMRGQEVASNLILGRNLFQSKSWSFLLEFMLSSLATLIIVFVSFKERSKKLLPIQIGLVATLFLIIFIAPYQEMRYLNPYLIATSTLAPIAIKLIPRNWTFIAITIFITSSFFTSQIENDNQDIYNQKRDFLKDIKHLLILGMKDEPRSHRTFSQIILHLPRGSKVSYYSFAKNVDFNKFDGYCFYNKNAQASRLHKTDKLLQINSILCKRKKDFKNL
ncbi:MAG: hypothetical protein CME64_01455 [Halobacteriovoraceae bacterium]|nr:hypothetical protein [Halobacteriovoraceae bacterium]